MTNIMTAVGGIEDRGKIRCVNCSAANFMNKNVEKKGRINNEKFGRLTNEETKR